ncbi:MAG: FHA domain-containing protein [Bdellovibrionota bacterium]
MSFRYTIEVISKNGAVDTRSQEYSAEELILGRGSAADILLESSHVSLKHAKLSVKGDVLAVEDLGSLSGVKVNNRLIQRQQLQAGDTLTLGDVVLSVTRTKGEWGLFEKRKLSQARDGEEQVGEELKHLNLGGRIPSYTLIASFLCVLVMAFFFVVPFAKGAKRSWSSGPISNKHQFFASDCETCHNTPFAKVAESQCTSCHAVTEHSAALKANHQLQGECTSCHVEHKGDAGLVLHRPQTCTECHGNIKRIDQKAKSADVASFGKHPEFSVLVPPVKPGEGEILRIRLSETDKLADHSNVKLNHELHLKGPLRSSNGEKTLTCGSCHELSATGKSIEPINYKKHCADCHRLGFDERLPEKVVPHGNGPDDIYKFLYAEYAKLLLSSEQDAKAKEFVNTRLKPGESLPTETAARDDFKRGVVEQESRAAEKMLFSKTACFLCHDVRERKDIPPQELGERSAFEVLPPQIPSNWMKPALFSHSAHDAVDCESCHKSARHSKATNDVLLPGIQNCRSCHADPGTKDKVQSDCTMCHSFHEKSQLPSKKRRTIDEFFHGGA